MATVGRTVFLTGTAWLLATLLPAPGFWMVAKLASIALAIVVGYVFLGEFSERELAWGRAMLRVPTRFRA
jgi:uncharacterized membrane protein SirB2